MTAAEHAAEAERLLTRAVEVLDEFDDAAPTLGASEIGGVKAAALGTHNRLVAQAHVHAVLATVPEYAIAELVADEQVGDLSRVEVGSRVVAVEAELNDRGFRYLDDIEIGTVIADHLNDNLTVRWDRLRHAPEEDQIIPRERLRVILGV